MSAHWDVCGARMRSAASTRPPMRGATWQRILYVDDKTGVIDVQMNPQDPNTLLVATYERQRDGFDGNDPAKKYGPGSGVYLTKDGGATFQKVTQGLPTCNLGRIGISISRQDPQHVFLVLESEKIGLVPENAGYAGIARRGRRRRGADCGSRRQVAGRRSWLEVGRRCHCRRTATTILSYRELQTAIDKHVVGDKLKLTSRASARASTWKSRWASTPHPRNHAVRDVPCRRKSSSERTASTPAGLGGQNENLEQGSDGPRVRRHLSVAGWRRDVATHQQPEPAADVLQPNPRRSDQRPTTSGCWARNST